MEMMIKMVKNRPQLPLKTFHTLIESVKDRQSKYLRVLNTQIAKKKDNTQRVGPYHYEILFYAAAFGRLFSTTCGSENSLKINFF